MNSRRDFLQKLALPAVVLPFIPLSAWAANHQPGENYQGPQLRVAIMGLGGYGTRVAEAMKSSVKAKLVGVISGTPAKVKDWQAKYGIPEKNCYNYENFDNIRNNPDIDAVYVITPNALHHNQVIRVAAAGKHVICEKPMALNAQEGQEMVDACKKANVKLLVGYRLHFEPRTLEVVRMRKDGEFGKINFFQGLAGFKIGDPGQWRLSKKLAGGGALMDIGIYAINGARYMVGEEPAWVTAQETKTDPVKFKEGVDETIQFQFGFPSGAVASCLSTYNMNHLDRFFLTGEKGFAEMLPSTGYGPLKGRTHKGELTQPIVTHQTVQMDEMAEIILADKQPVVPVDGEEGLRDLKIIDAIYAAVKKGTRVPLKLLTVLFILTFTFLNMQQSQAQDATQTRSAKLNHIAVYVANLDRSASFYESLFNLPRLEEPFKDGRHVWFSLGAAGQLHLIQGPIKKVDHDKNEHLCFSVTSVTAFIAKLDQQKIDYSNWPGTAKEPTLRVDGVKQIYFQDPDGHWLEVNDAP